MKAFKPSGRSAAIVAAIFFLLASGFVHSWWHDHFGPGYFSELNTVREQLNRIPDIEAVEVTWYEDTDIPFLPVICHISAHIRLESGGEMVLRDLTAESFEKKDSFILGSVDGNSIRYRGEGYVGVYKAATLEPVRSRFAGGRIDVGPNGDFASFFPFEISNVQTAVEQYNEISRVIGKWPRTPEPPGFFTSSKGTDFLYWIAPLERDKEDSSWHSDPNWKRPYAELRASVSES